MKIFEKEVSKRRRIKKQGITKRKREIKKVKKIKKWKRKKQREKITRWKEKGKKKFENVRRERERQRNTQKG